MNNQKTQTQKIVIAAILTALVVVLQFMGSFIRFGMFSISLVLVPIVIGAALCGYKAAAWLGFVFGVAVLLSGDAAAFLAIDILGTVVTVLLKGTLCGLAAGLTYKLLEGKNRYIAVMVAAVVCPVVNTGVFLLGCLVFFLNTVAEWGKAVGFENVGSYMLFGLVGMNFVFELVTNIILAPVILRIEKFAKKV